MAILPILEYPHPFLNQKAEEVLEFDAELQKNIDSMFETLMSSKNNGAIAAPQVHYGKRVVVIGSGYSGGNPLCLINPIITHKEGTTGVDEGCLSLPGIAVYVERARNITLQYQDRQGTQQELQATGLFAICIQHERDHLDGILSINHLPPSKRARILKKYEEQHAKR
jgi:peptide deformylase